jgi:RHS repeat-associated protein
MGATPQARATSATTRTDTFTYDANGRTDIATNAANTVIDYDFDARGLLTQRIDAKTDTVGNKRTTQTDWNATFAVPNERRTYDAAGTLVAKQTWTYNTRGQVLTASQIDPATSAVRTTTTSYCEQADITAGTCPLIGLVKSVNGPRTDVSDVTTYTYYASDDATCASAPTTCPHRKADLWKVTNALVQSTETLKYDGAGRVLSVKDPNGVITDLEYHPRGWLTARKVRGTNNSVETDDVITRIDYWPTGLVKQVTQPDGAFTTYTYDAAHRLTDISDNAGNTHHYTLDNTGNRTVEDSKDSQGTLLRTLSRTYDQLGQLRVQQDAYQHATGFTYDATGNSDATTDALSRVTDNDYDPLNRLAKTIQDVGGINATTQFQYDARDNLTAVIDPKTLTTGYTYNGLGDLTQLTSPDTGVSTYTYDSGGNRKTQQDARSTTTTYGYDVLNRLLTISYPTTSLNVTYVYDTSNAICASGETFAQGRLAKMTDGSGSTQYCYDRFGNLVRKVQTTNGKVFTLRYGYTMGGRLASLMYPDGSVADYVRDAQGRTTEIGVTPAAGARQVLLTSASYYPFGPVAGWSYGNGRTLQRTFNQNYQPTLIEDGAAGGLSLGYTFNAVGNLDTLYSPQPIDPDWTGYDYDGLNRLTNVKDGPTDVSIETYGYDATGNRISLSNAGTTTLYTYPTTSHRLSSVGSITRTYDTVGNLAKIGNGGNAKGFVFDATNRMSQVKNGNQVAMNYAYTGKGEQVRRYATATSNTQTYAVHDEAAHWLGEYDVNGAPLQQAVWLDDVPVGLLVGALTNQKLHYVEADALGSPRAVIDPVRNVAIWNWSLKGEAFGASAPNQNPDGDANQFVFNMRFPGQRYDAASGLNYNYFRDYESSTGRYVESDPIGLDGGISTYGYANDNSLKYIDPYGLWTVRGPQVPDPGTVSPSLLAFINCVQNCFKLPLIVTATTNGHTTGAHARGTGIDFVLSNGAAGANDALCCALGCGAAFVQDEYHYPSPHATGPHIHAQLDPGKGGATGTGSKPRPKCKPCEQ